jgi:hypothetical protein
LYPYLSRPKERNMDQPKKVLARRAAAVAVISGTLVAGGVSTATAAPAASKASSSHSALLTNVTPQSATPTPYTNNGCTVNNQSCGAEL